MYLYLIGIPKKIAFPSSRWRIQEYLLPRLRHTVRPLAGVPVVGDGVEIGVGRTEQHMCARGQGHLFQFDRHQIPVVLRRVQIAKHAGALKKNKSRFRGLNRGTAVYETEIKSWHYFQTQVCI